MFREKIPQQQYAGWLFVAMTAPLARSAGMQGWLPALVAAIICLGLCWIVHVLPTEHLWKKRWYCILQIVWLVITLAALADWSADAWPTGGDFPVVPLTLITLAVFAALNGPVGGSRVSGVLLWFLVLLYGIVLAAGSKNIKPGWLLPKWENPGVSMLFVLLLPAAGVFLPREKGRTPLWVFLAILLFFTALALWTVGTISPKVAGEVGWPFYESAKSLSLLGVAERFESLVSVAMTLGYFSLYSLLLCGVGNLAENLHPGWGRWGVIAGGVAAGILVLLALCPAPVVLVIITLIAWGLLPVFGAFTELWKKSKKDEKTT